MTRAGKMDRLGWIATAFGAIATIAAAGCASGPRSEPVSTTSTTGASTPTTDSESSVELYVARQRPVGTAACGGEPIPNIEFPARSAELRTTEVPHIDRWAACLTKRELEHVNVVLIGGDDPNGPNGHDGLFLLRAQQIKNALTARGVDPARVVIAAPNPAITGGPWASAPGVHIEVTHLDEVRGLGAPDSQIRRAVR